jgi:hypothetical protein
VLLLHSSWLGALHAAVGAGEAWSSWMLWRVLIIGNSCKLYELPKETCSSLLPGGLRVGSWQRVDKRDCLEVADQAQLVVLRNGDLG